MSAVNKLTQIDKKMNRETCFIVNDLTGLYKVKKILVWKESKFQEKMKELTPLNFVPIPLSFQERGTKGVSLSATGSSA
jgi:hypothetical protein